MNLKIQIFGYFHLPEVLLHAAVVVLREDYVLPQSLFRRKSFQSFFKLRILIKSTFPNLVPMPFGLFIFSYWF